MFILFFNVKSVFQIQIINKIFASYYTILLPEGVDFVTDSVTDCFSEMSVKFDEQFNWKYVIFKIQMWKPNQTQYVSVVSLYSSI
jgi:hypothetical protein